MMPRQKWKVWIYGMYLRGSFINFSDELRHLTSPGLKILRVTMTLVTLFGVFSSLKTDEFHQNASWENIVCN